LVADCKAVDEYGTQPHEVVEMLAAMQPTTMNVDCRTVDDAHHAMGERCWATYVTNSRYSTTVVESSERLDCTYTRLSSHVPWWQGAYIDPSHPYSRRVVHQSCSGITVTSSPT